MPDESPQDANLTRDGLERLRKRLLDLTNRNKLLNFQHRGKACLRVVDELPDVLFQQLLEGTQLIFKPVAEPKTDEYIDNLALPNVAEIPTPADKTAQPPGQRRHQPRKPSAREYAAKLGIRIDYDLPEPIGEFGEHPHHQDRYIQTLHYAVDLEAVLRRIYTLSRTAIEESGANMLYLVFGFLEWYEADSSEEPLYAPLVMVPVTLAKRAPRGRIGTFEYTVTYSGDDLMTNLSLVERLKAFGLEVPSLEDGDTPEKYFEKLAGIQQAYPRWRIRRQVTLSLLHFGKLLMFLDLDSARWPDREPETHPRIRELFEGTQRDDLSYAEDYLIDNPEHHNILPHLIYDADSSQHSALIDAIGGQSLVIQGPPGTGKSQTITNLIGAALAAGKRILFVAEKLAALEVVQRRLVQAELGHFCLELHSHKTQKKEILAALAQRIQSRRQFQNPTDFDGKLRVLDRQKKELIEHVQLMNTPLDPLGYSIFTILWRRYRCLQRYSILKPIEDRLILSALPVQSPADFDQLQLDCELYQQQLSHLCQTWTRINNHPWYGVTRLDWSLPLQDLFHLGERLATQTQSLLGTFRSVQAIIGPDTTCDSDSLRRVIAWRTQFPQCARENQPEWIGKLGEGAFRQALTQFIDHHQQYQAERQGLAERFHELPMDLGVEWHASIQYLEAQGSGQQTLGSLAARLEQARKVVQQLQVIEKTLVDIESQLGITLSKTWETAKSLSSVFTLLTAASPEVLALRNPIFKEADLPSIRRKAEAEAGSLEQERAELAKRFRLSHLPSADILGHYGHVLVSTSWLGRWLNKEYKAARVLYIELRGEACRATPSEIAQDLWDLEDYLDRRKRFEANPEYRRAFGPQFHGLETQFQLLKQVESWTDEVQQAFFGKGEEVEVIGQTLLSSPTSQLAALRAWGNTHQEVAALFQSVPSVVEELLERDLPLGESCNKQSVRTLRDLTESYSARLEEALSHLRPLNLLNSVRVQEVTQLMRRLKDWRAMEVALNADSQLQALLGNDFKGSATDPVPLKRALAIAEIITSTALPSTVKQWLLAPDFPCRLDQIETLLPILDSQFCAWQNQWDQFSNALGIDIDRWFHIEEPRDLVAHHKRLRQALDSSLALNEWLSYLESQEPLRTSGVSILIEEAERGRLEPPYLSAALEFLVFNTLAQQVVEAHPHLQRFSRVSHERIRERFAKLDAELMTAYRQRVAFQTNQHPIAPGNGRGPIATWTELSLLKHEIGKQRNHLPIRQLLKRAGKAIQALKPCFMMSPMSVAQYLAAGNLKFDLVVMDEASQLKPEDAVGAILRGNQMVIVGDDQQLPPTSFFDTLLASSDTEEEDALAIEDSESILEIAQKLYQPIRQLRWHYRSRHESLIAFSNHEFYNRQLIIFPSPYAEHEQLGIKYHFVRDGIYDHRTNRREAEHIIEAIVQHAMKQPDASLGVVTLNSTQRDLIEELFESRMKRDPHLQAFFALHEDKAEPFFIKNLETVQGDERDVIYISVTYGRDLEGNLYQRFGPLNGINGHRRLNVLFTRAKLRTEVFTSLQPEDILAESTSHRGVHVFKGYLTYAKSGVLHQPQSSQGESDSPFEDSVRHALESRGYQVVPQVGVAGYRIDLAVRHPTKPGCYLLGIECDGATYHSARSARDRDRLREENLKNLQWRLHRIWSTDWFRNPDAEIERIANLIDILQRCDQEQNDTI